MHTSKLLSGFTFLLKNLLKCRAKSGTLTLLSMTIKTSHILKTIKMLTLSIYPEGISRAKQLTSIFSGYSVIRDKSSLLRLRISFTRGWNKMMAEIMSSLW